MAKNAKEVIMQRLLDLCAKAYGVGKLQISSAGYGVRGNDLRIARGAFLYVAKEMGFKHKDACEYINLNKGNGSSYRQEFELGASASEKLKLTQSASAEIKRQVL